MKRATVKYHQRDDKATIGTLIESIEDLKEFQVLIESAAHNTSVKFIKSGEPPERLNHVSGSLRGIEKGIGALALNKGWMEENSPILHLGYASQMMITSILCFVAKGESVFVNEKGGICPMDSLELIGVEIVEAIFTPQPTLRSGKVINLENDPELEMPAWNFMENELKDKNFSYITELRLYDGKRLERTFKKFMEGGGDTIYVYTTGQDVDQMYEYSQAGLSAGIRKFIFQFKFGTDPNIDRFLEWLGHRANVQNIPVKK